MRDWQRYAFDPALARWAGAANEAATKALADPAQAHQYRYGRTWFVGVDALPNAPDGSLNGVPLHGEVIDGLTRNRWHEAQLSVTFPGYPQRMDGESDSQHRFRVTRDAAHVDGLLPMGPTRRRHLIEPHAFILGLPLNAVSESPLVVWEGSAAIMNAAFTEALEGVPSARWSEVDLTEIYQAARKSCFENCPRVEARAKPGEALLLHRLTLHGVAPWAASEPCTEGRRIAYFRPQLENPADWLP
ncbi:hypothetical protein [Cognatishimia sp. MH4019]|uniref:hypothetical protein n=1 Tax=Cognatishimia sp. MH4019 TaxID=2854030 RepID=UPI001CD3083B|nr:hypothetical protein [Cognatishimia sp. MH4019]